MLAATAIGVASIPKPTLSVHVREAKLIDPLSVLAQTEGGFYVRLPNERYEAAGLGIAWQFRTSGPSRFQEVRDAAQALLAGLPGEVATKLKIWGGFSFADQLRCAAWSGFGEAWFFLPAYQYVVEHGRAFEIIIDGAPAYAPTIGKSVAFPQITADSWRKTAATALASVQAGNLSKIVLARTLTLQNDKPWQAPAVLEKIRQRHSGAIFAFRSHADWFISATPELLANVQDGRLTTQAVAGTAKRGATVAEDGFQAHLLLESNKDQREHQWVIDSIRTALAPIAISITNPPAPQIMRLPHMLHLVTPLEAYLQAGVHVLDAIARLHPTAAVGGFPHKAVLQWLQTHEGFDRGWYAAPIGFFDVAGNGSFWVAIRSALLRESEAILFAGAGLVEGSTPEIEWNETELKLETLRGVLETQ